MENTAKSQAQTYSLEETRRVLGVGRNAIYEAARRGDFPTFRIGKLIRAPKKVIDRLAETGTSTPST